jgi:hypothetical protein
MFILIHHAFSTVDDSAIKLVGTYHTREEAHAEMMQQYQGIIDAHPEWDGDLCEFNGISAVAQEWDEPTRWYWFIFNSDDAGIPYIFS